MSLVEQDRLDAILLLRLNDPARRNLLSLPLCRALSQAVAAANSDDSVKAIVITGTAPAFCAGASLDDLQAAATGETEAVHAVYQSFIDVANSAVPTIAAVNGAAVGAGLNLALACDIRLASTDAMFDTRFLKIGLHPGGGHGWMLLRAVGWAEAARLLLLADPVRANEALRIGLVQQLLPPADLIGTALTLAERTHALPRQLLIETKQSLRHAVGATHAQAFAHETEAQLRSLTQPAFAEMSEALKARLGSR